MKHVLAAALATTFLAGLCVVPASAKQIYWDCGWHENAAGKKVWWGRCSGKARQVALRMSQRDPEDQGGQPRESRGIPDDQGRPNDDGAAGNGGDGHLNAGTDDPTKETIASTDGGGNSREATDQTDNGNHYGNDKPDNNDNDDRNKHDGEETKADHHDSNGGGASDDGKGKDKSKDKDSKDKGPK